MNETFSNISPKMSAIGLISFVVVTITGFNLLEIFSDKIGSSLVTWVELNKNQNGPLNVVYTSSLIP